MELAVMFVVDFSLFSQSGLDVVGQAVKTNKTNFNLQKGK